MGHERLEPKVTLAFSGFEAKEALALELWCWIVAVALWCLQRGDTTL